MNSYTTERRAAHREREILDFLRERGGTSRILPLAQALEVSEETIRRNVKRLADEGLVEKVHGGVHLAPETGEPPLLHRIDLNTEKKSAIAKQVAEIISDGDSLFLDVGSTTTYVARALRQRRSLFVVTNSIEVARLLAARNDNKVFMAGGELRQHDGGAFGVEAIDFVRRFQVKYAVFSAAAINAEAGFMLFDLHEAQFAREIVARSEKRIIAADSTKFSRLAPIAVDDPSTIDILVTDASPPTALQTALTAWNIELVLADR